MFNRIKNWAKKPDANGVVKMQEQVAHKLNAFASHTKSDRPLTDLIIEALIELSHESQSNCEQLNQMSQTQIVKLLAKCVTGLKREYHVKNDAGLSELVTQIENDYMHEDDSEFMASVQRQLINFKSEELK